MKLLKIGISGVRGIVGETITPDLVMDFASAFGTFSDRRKILIGRDTRVSGPMLHTAVLSALSAAGCDVVELGICPTPILQYMVKRLKAGGAVSISAGHNGWDWNALTFINQEGMYLNEFQGEEILDIYHLGRFYKAPYNKLGRIGPKPDFLDEYFRSLIRYLDMERIKKARFKIVIDACNGAGAKMIDLFSKSLHCKLIAVNNELSGFFPHPPEPAPRNATEAASIVKLTGADVGFVLNSDVSRVSLITEEGEPLSEEYTLPLVAGHFLRRKPGPVITTHSTSRMIADVALSHGCPLVRTKVGQSFTVQTLVNEEGSLAGEGSGSIALRDFQPAFDGFLAMGEILETMATSEKKLSELAAELPRYYMFREKIYCPPSKAHSIVSRLKDFFSGEEVSYADGIKLENEDGWIHIRVSVTEPMIRIISESAIQEQAEKRLQKVLNFISQFI
ncbi:MAG: hypothetical protein HYU64_14040 [Armatimonadetes bacterium]|nr:hypothetical protein [Armatimonadota bacterium]